MTGLAALFAKQKAKESAASPHSGIGGTGAQKNPEPANPESDAELKAAAVKAENEARLAEEKATPEKPESAKPAKPTLANVFAKAAAPKPQVPAQSESKPAAKPNPFARSAATPVAKPASTALDKLAAIDLSEFGSDSDDGGSNIDDPEVAYFSRFADEEPATKPERDLPADMTDNEKAFVAQLDSMYEVIHDPEMMSTCLRTFMIELQENPEYTRLVAPEDVRTLILGARATMGLAKVKKQEAKAKRASGGSSKSRKKAVDLGIGDLSDLLAGFGGDD